MKNTRKYIFGLVAAAATLLLTSCPDPTSTPPVEITMDVGGLPADSQTYDIEILAFTPASDGDYEAKTVFMARVASSSQLQAKLVPPVATEFFGLYLFTDSSEPLFFMSADFSSGSENGTISVHYWLYYPEYFDSGLAVFGVSADAVASLPFESTASQDFSAAPYFVYSVEQPAQKTFTVRAAATQGSIACKAGTALAGIGRYGTSLSGSEYSSRAYPAATLYLVVVPTDYVTHTASTLIVEQPSGSGDPPAPSGSQFSFSQCELGSDGSVYFADTTHNAIETWARSTGEFTSAKSFETTPSAMTRGGDDLYLAEGPRLWRLNTLTGVADQVLNAAANIGSLAYLGTHLLVNDASGSWSTNSLVRLSDFTVTSQRTWVSPSRTSVFFPAQGRLYLLRDWSSPDDLCYQDVDLAAETLGTYGDSPYHGDYVLAHPLKQLKGEQKVVTAAGTIFDVSGTITYAGSLGRTYDDLVYADGRFYLLSTTESFSNPADSTMSLKILGETSPYAVLSIPVVETNRYGKRLLLDGDRLLVVSSEAGGINAGAVHVQEYTLSGLDIMPSASQKALGTIRQMPRLQDLTRYPARKRP